MTFQLRPAVRENTPLIVGIAGPTKSGKTYSAHRLAQGLAAGGPIAMLNAEGARGHQYADKFKYLACDIDAPFSYPRYEEAIGEIAKMQPACLIIDSASHAHDGPGGMLEQHDAELDRMAGKEDYKKRERMNFAAWIKPKAVENHFIYRMLSLKCPVILCFRAKEKLKIVPGQQPIDLGWQPIASDRIAFETIFTLTLPPHSKGVPVKALSELREPFEEFVSWDKPIDERLGQRLREWSAGAKASSAPQAEKSPPPSTPAEAAGFKTRTETLMELCGKAGVDYDKVLERASVKHADEMSDGDFKDAKEALEKRASRKAA